MSRIDIAPHDLAIVRDILNSIVPEREVRVFGSRVTGRAKKFSDLDLVVMGDTPLTLHEQAVLADAFDESDLPFKVDVVDWATTAETFQAIIDRDAVALNT